MKVFSFKSFPLYSNIIMILVYYCSEAEAGNRQQAVLKGSLIGLPPSLNIKSEDLRVLHPIGQGIDSNDDNVLLQ